MNEMTSSSIDTLSALQAVLDGLGTGEILRLTNSHCDRLFGVNEALAGRVANFARGHNCIVVWDDNGLTFRRQPLAATATVSPASEPRT